MTQKTDKRKIYIGFDPLRLTSTFSYAVKENIEKNIKDYDLDITYNPQDDYIAALFPSSEDMMSCFPKIRKGTKTYLLVGSDPEDIDLNRKSGSILTEVALTQIDKADGLIALFPRHKTILQSFGITKEIRILNVVPTYDKLALDDYERKAFRSYYRIPDDKVLCASFGFHRDSESYSMIESIARICPDIEFIYFGFFEKEFLRLKMQERMLKSLNVRFLPAIPPELYKSALVSIDCLLLTRKEASYPTMINDFITQGKTELISLEESYLEDLVNEKTATICEDFHSLYTALEDLRRRKSAEK